MMAKLLGIAMHKQSDQADESALLQLNQQSPKRHRLLKHWLRCQRQAIIQAMQGYVAEPLANAFTIGVIAVAFALPLVLFTLLININTALQSWHGAPQMTLYLNANTSTQTLIQTLQSNPAIDQVRYISPAQGLAQLENQDSHIQSAFSALNSNPLPGVVIVTPTHTTDTPAQLHKLKQQLSALTPVASVQMNETWVKRLYYMGQTLSRLVIAIACLFGVALIFIIGNTTRLDMQKHAHEIRVLRLIGANAGFIRRPLVYQALLYSITACCLAFVICGVLLHILNGPLSQLAFTYQSQFSLHPIPPHYAGIVLLIACLLSYMGAQLAIRQHLTKH